jgi:hypothetical protein
MENELDIRDEFLDLEKLADINSEFIRFTNQKMLDFFIEMDSDIEFIEFERWLIDG